MCCSSPCWAGTWASTPVAAWALAGPPWGLALLGVVVSMTATLLPSSVLTYTATRWAHRHRERRTVRAFKAGMAPIVIALLIATGWLLTAAHDQPASDWPLYLLTAAATLLVWRTRIHLLWLIGRRCGAGCAGLGLIAERLSAGFRRTPRWCNR